MRNMTMCAQTAPNVTVNQCELELNGHSRLAKGDTCKKGGGGVVWKLDRQQGKVHFPARRL